METRLDRLEQRLDAIYEMVALLLLAEVQFEPDPEDQFPDDMPLVS